VFWQGAMTGGIAGLLLVGWMGIGAQVEAALGNVHFPTKPVSVTGCNCTIGEIPPTASPGSVSH